MHSRLFLVCLCVATASIPLRAADDSPAVDYRLLTLNLEDYRNDRVTYDAAYHQFFNEIPGYLVRSGITEGKYLALVIGSFHLPVAIKADQEVKNILLALKPGDIVRVNGKVRPLVGNPANPLASKYYLHADSIVPTGQSLTREIREQNRVDQPGGAGRLLHPRSSSKRSP